ncbi:MAG: DUF4365 domain-containing protein [Candidatus Daviesbacteria bacterium]|nr:DUF4365 domain-containing protein [Candidatus Daviesbacteria bacterium]
MHSLPVYTANKRKGNIGEALAQYIFSKFCLVHKIDGSNDLGNDFICELIRDQHPTNLLFYVQVKYTNNPPRIKEETKEYWKSSPIPVYIFWIKDKKPPVIFDPDLFRKAKTYYKRLTPLLHNESKHKNEKFKPYKEIDFKRDLIVDYVRTQYKEGFTPIIEPRAFLNIDEKLQTDLPQYAFYIRDVIPEYSEDILSKGWANLFSLAVILYKKGDRENLELAHHLIDLAITLYKKERGEDDSRIYNSMVEYEIDIADLLNRS